METKIFHGKITPNEVGQALISQFNTGNLRAQKVGSGNQVVVQVATTRFARSGGQTAMTITVQKHKDGVAVKIGKQSWLGVAASLGQTAFAALRNPVSLLGRLDDIAQDIESMNMTTRAWEVIEDLARTKGATHALAERLRRVVCEYCDSANEVGAPQCIACGAPLGRFQPKTCMNCGFVVQTDEPNCPNCGKIL